MWGIQLVCCSDSNDGKVYQDCIQVQNSQSNHKQAIISSYLLQWAVIHDLSIRFITAVWMLILVWFKSIVFPFKCFQGVVSFQKNSPHFCLLCILQNLPSHKMAWSTSKGYFMSPSTKPGVSTKVTRLNFFCLEVLISVFRYSTTPRMRSE